MVAISTLSKSRMRLGPVVLSMAVLLSALSPTTVCALSDQPPAAAADLDKVGYDADGSGSVDILGSPAVAAVVDGAAAEPLQKRGFTFQSPPSEYDGGRRDAGDATGPGIKSESFFGRVLNFPASLRSRRVFANRLSSGDADAEEFEDRAWKDDIVDDEVYEEYGQEFIEGEGNDYDDEEDEDDDDYDDCDNGNDDDDGSQWHTGKPKAANVNDRLDRASGFNRPVRTRFSRETSQGLAPFPKWLQDITHMTQWPSRDAPYIPMPGISLQNIPDIPMRELGNCSSVSLDHCSFDCYRCLALDEIMTCPVMSQTFDDGPSPGTPKLLERLPGKTTFFTQGINVVRFPDTFKDQHAKGHLVASHTWSHANLAGVSNEQIVAQIQWSIWAMNATAGVIPKFFRPPYGASDNRVRAIIRQFGLVSVFWDRDTFDWQVNDKKKTTDQVLADVRGWRSLPVPGGLILEHDSTIDTVNLGIDVANILGGAQYTVAECVNSKWYQDKVTWQ